MTQAGYVHGGTDAREVARLEKQADFTASFTFSTLALKPGMRVLDLATGVGAMGARLRRACPEALVVGVDLSAGQLAAARRNHSTLPVLRGDATQLPFADGTFERVHCSWLLEHVPSPVAVLREVRRVLRPGGFCQFVEVDNSTFQTEPRCEAAHTVLGWLNEAQLRGGGDPFVAKKLPAAFLEAGFSHVEVVPHAMHGHAGARAFFEAFVVEFAEIFEGLDESLGVAAMPTIEAAAAELRALLDTPGASMRYTPSIARGFV